MPRGSFLVLWVFVQIHTYMHTCTFNFAQKTYLLNYLVKVEYVKCRGRPRMTWKKVVDNVFEIHIFKIQWLAVNGIDGKGRWCWHWWKNDWCLWSINDWPSLLFLCDRQTLLVHLMKMLSFCCQQLWRDWINRLSLQHGLPIAFSMFWISTITTTVAYTVDAEADATVNYLL